MKMNFLDRAINFLNPKAGTERMRHKMAQEVFKKNSGKRRYEAAGGGRRTDGWHAVSTSGNAEIHQALIFLRNRSRDLVRNNPYAENAIKEISNSMVGTGIIPTPKDLSPLQTKKIKKAWSDWAESTDCDWEGHSTFYGIQHLIARSVAESGECIVRKHIIADKKLAIPLKLQVLEADYIDTTKYMWSLPEGGFIYYGVEFDKDQKIVAYWLWDQHPGEQIHFNVTLVSRRVPADQILHIFEKKRPGQFRGVPFGTASMLRLKDMDDYEDAQLIRQKIAACFSVFVTDSTNATVGDQGNAEELLDKVEPGIIQKLSPGQTVSMATPPDAGQTFDPYTKNILRGVAAGYGMDYVTLTGDLTAVNFSSGRMGWLKFHKNVSVWQTHMLIPMLCDPAWAWFIQVASIMGFAKSDKTIKARWTPPRREMIDPAKESKALVEMIRAGLMSLPEAIRQMGDAPEDVIEEMIATAKLFDAAKLMPTTDPRFDATRSNGAIPPPPGADGAPAAPKAPKKSKKNK
jgi:lambda family phage portal protein